MHVSNSLETNVRFYWIFFEDAFFVPVTEGIIPVNRVIQAILVDRLEESRPLIRGRIEASQAILITHHGNPYNVGRFTLAIKHFTTPANKKTFNNSTTGINNEWNPIGPRPRPIGLGCGNRGMNFADSAPPRPWFYWSRLGQGGCNVLSEQNLTDMDVPNIAGMRFSVKKRRLLLRLLCHYIAKTYT